MSVQEGCDVVSNTDNIKKRAVKKNIVDIKKTEEPVRMSKTAPKKLKLLITVVNAAKAEFYTDFLQSFEVNMQLSLLARGTANSEILGMLGITESEKAVIISIIRSDRAPEALKQLEEKFSTIRNGKGIAFTVPLTSTIGVAIYRFLSNSRA